MPQTSDFPPVLDTAMVAELLGMNVQVVRRMAREELSPATGFPAGARFASSAMRCSSG